MILALVGTPTAWVVNVNVPDDLPVGTIAIDGTIAEALDEVIVTDTPDGPARPVRVTVPVLVPPPPMLTGFKASKESVGGLIVTVADL